MEPVAVVAVHGMEERDMAGGMRYLARQPILDARGRVHAYELLFRPGPQNTSSRCQDDLATRIMLDNSILFGMEELARGLPAFVKCSPAVITEEQVRILPPNMTVLELPESAQPVPAFIQACIRLKSLGYRLALGHFVWQPSLQPLVSLADYIKIDFLKSSAQERGNVLARLPSETLLVAENLQTRADFEIARTEGFSLFEGYYFCAPSIVRGARVPTNKIFHLQMLQLLQEDPIDLHRLGELVKRDAGLTYRLLRLVNSPAWAIRQEVRSIEMALIAVGDDHFRRLASVAIASELNNGESTEVLRMAFVRARFCELAAAHLDLEPGEQYLIGLFSMLPAMLKASMFEVLIALPLRQPVQDALLGDPVPLRRPLQWIEAEERRDWEHCHQIALECDVAPAELVDCYLSAVLWADQTLTAAETAHFQAEPSGRSPE